jgi:type IV secretion system protein VirB6
MIGTLLLQLVESYATQTAARGTEIQTVDAINMVLVAVLAFLLLRQVMPIASGLAGGLALSSFGMVSRAASVGMRTSAGGAVRAVRFTKRRFQEDPR